MTSLALVAGVVSYAQSPTTGMIVGKVVDSAGKAVAGAQIRLTGPAVQGARTAVTEADGTYRIPLIPVGTGFGLKVSSSAGTAEGKNLGIDPWKTHVFNFTVRQAGSTEAVVEVIASAAGIDTSNVTTATTINTDSLQALPMASRDYMAAAYLAPGVVDGGRGASNPNISGGTAFENNYIIDGQNVTDPFLGENRTRINTLSIETVQVQSGGYEPEYGRATGGIISVVTKTGSNDFRFDVEASFRPKSTIAVASAQTDLPFNAARVAQGNQETLAMWLGGAIIKDKLWYSVGIAADSTETGVSYGKVYFLDPQQAAANPLTQPINAPGHVNNGTAYSLKDKNLGFNAKLTYSFNSDNTIEFGLNRNRQKTDANNLGLSLTDTASTVVRHPNDVDTLSLNWRSTITPSWLLDVRAATYKRKQFDDLSNDQRNTMWTRAALPPYLLAGDFAHGAPVFPQFNARAYPGIQMGGFAVDATNELTRKQFTAKSSNFIGDHTVKYGIDYDETGYKSFFGYTGGATVTREYNVNPSTGAFVSFRDTYRFRRGINGRSVTVGTNTTDKVLLPGQGLDLDSKSKNLAFFLQDTWQISKNWTVLFGVRADSQKLYGGDGQEYLTFKFSEMTAPRVGLIWDPTGEGKTKISGSFGRFYETVPMDLNQRAGSEEGFVEYRRTYSGTAATAFLYQSMNVNDVFNPATGVGNGPNPANGGGSTSFRRTIGGEKSAVDPDIKPQSIEEIALGWEQQLTPLWKAGFKFKYRYYKHVIEDYSFDFGNTYFIGNPGQGGNGSLPIRIQGYDYPGQDEYVTFPKPVRNYRETVLTLDKAKGADAWTLSASLTFAHNIGNFAGLDSPLNGQADPNITSTYDLPVLMRNTYGPLPNTPKYNLQLTGTYDLGKGFNLGARFFYRAGTAVSALGPDLGPVIGGITASDVFGVDPYGVGGYAMFNGQFLHTGNYGDNEALLEPRGSRGTTPDVTRTDIHFEWATTIPALKKSKVTVFLDIFNLFNQQMALTLNQTKQFSSTVAGYGTDATGTPTEGGVINPAYQGIIAFDNPRFLKPTSFQAPRSLQFGVRFNF